MGLSQRLVLKQGQSLVMTPQLQQAIKLLQMSAAELQAYVEAEIERNPLLEREEAADTKATVTDRNPEPLDKAFSTPVADETMESAVQISAPLTSADGQAQLRDSAWSSLRSSGHLSINGEGQDFAASLSKEETLAEHLTNQLNLQISQPGDRLIGQHLIGMVNEAGYLTGDVAGLAASLGATSDHVESVLQILKGFEPTGVFAANLSECLRLQLAEQNLLDEAMGNLVGHLDLVARRDYRALCQICRVSMEDLQGMLASLKRLNPKPGNAFGSEPVTPVVPDVIVRPSPDGSWIVELNSETLPRVLVNNRYLAQVSRNTTRDEDKLFLADCHANAAWLVKSLDQRANTVLKVAREIVSQQDAFLVHGIQYLKPITLKTVADAIGMHESTVSRVTSNKYMATPRGLHELKYFFTNAIAASAAGEAAHSSESVRHRIRELVAAEQQNHILSDDDIVETLRKEGIDLARRTVAKYRESLGILSSVQRRREARLKGSEGLT
jgi:RNA polymerase sigma-54 factor